MNKRIEQISQRSKEQILSELNSGVAYELGAKSTDASVHIKASEDPLCELKEKMLQNRFNVHQVQSKEQIASKINEITAAAKANKLIYPSSLSVDIAQINAASKICFNKPISELKDEVFSADFSIVDALFGVVSHGLVCLSSAQPRLLSLAPRLCIVLLDSSKLERSLDSALASIEAKCCQLQKPLSSNIVFLAGPSRTSDIELITVYGVHGSQQVDVILY